MVVDTTDSDVVEGEKGVDIVAVAAVEALVVVAAAVAAVAAGKEVENNAAVAGEVVVVVVVVVLVDEVATNEHGDRTDEAAAVADCLVKDRA